MSVLRLVGRRNRRSLLPLEVAIDLEDATNEWLVKSFFLLKKELRKRGLVTRNGYVKAALMDQASGSSRDLQRLRGR